MKEKVNHVPDPIIMYAEAAFTWQACAVDGISREGGNGWMGCKVREVS